MANTSTASGEAYDRTMKLRQMVVDGHATGAADLMAFWLDEAFTQGFEAGLAQAQRDQWSTA